VKSDLHEEENHIYIQMIINPHKREPVAMNLILESSVENRKWKHRLCACHRIKVFIAKQRIIFVTYFLSWPE